jgi:NTE family protein
MVWRAPASPTAMARNGTFGGNGSSMTHEDKSHAPMRDNSHAPMRKTHRVMPRPPFERIALVLQGGGALGAYQAGVYQALAEANLHPDRVAGISIGAVNAALVAGNPPDKRVARLREFWETVSTAPFGLPYVSSVEVKDELTHKWLNELRSMGNLLGGAPGFFKPRIPPPLPFIPGDLDSLSYYDVAPLKATLERLVDFDLINSGMTRFSVGAVNAHRQLRLFRQHHA